MFVLSLVLIGFFVFTIGAGIFGSWLRRHPTIENAEKSNRIMQILFYAGLVAPAVIVLVYPGLTQLDGMLGMPSLPSSSILLISGILLAFMGLYLLGTSNKLLRTKGNGANRFRLTDRIVRTDIYKRVRHPISLGYYLWSLSLGLISESTVVTMFVLLGFIPAHIFFLKYFEELELEIRFGEAYKQYKQRVPFLIPKIQKR